MVYRFIRGFRKVRDLLYTKHLGVTNVCTTCGLLCVGDVIIQVVENTYKRYNDTKEEDKTLDLNRTGRVFQVGVPSGLFSHVWYTNLDRFIPGKTSNIVFKKVFLDSALAGPVFLTIYFYGLARTEHKSHEESLQVLKEAFIPVYTADLCYWPLVQAVNFYIIPSRYRILFISVFQVMWNSFLSFMKHYEKNEALQKDANAILEQAKTQFTVDDPLYSIAQPVPSLPINK